MDLISFLKQLKRIEPDPDYRRGSLMRIVGTDVLRTPSPIALRRYAVARYFKFALSLGVAVIVVLFVAGVLPIRQPLIAGLDTSALRAEAEAIDIQLRLLQLKQYDLYQEQVLAVPESPAAVTPDDEALVRPTQQVPSPSLHEENAVSPSDGTSPKPGPGDETQSEPPPSINDILLELIQ